MHIRLNIKHLAIGGGGNFRPSSFVGHCTPTRKRNALTFFSLATFVVLFFVPAFVGCNKGDDAVPTNDPTTRSITHEDSVRMGLILKADSAWDGFIDEKF